MSKALIIIDIQNDYFQGGACELVNPMEASLKAKEVLEYFRKKDIPIFHIQHINIRKGATFFLPNTKGVQIHENVKPLENEIIIEKNFPNSFLETNLESELEKQNIKELVICGMMSHMCIDSTVRAAFDLGFDCTIAHDACTTKDLVFLNKKLNAREVHDSFMSALGSIFAKIVSIKEIIK
ncbi:cysteine hydrolase family protein [Arcobacter sp. s6]|jgi:nicotinamidase-related amidase|uniref:cysteine hydrolase family protein n=1 Tax=Arcobacter sp. s6 TaxID=3230363 RepID=UPI0034A0AD08